VGQEAVIDVDALPGEHFSGMVESLSPASGSEFALLPFEPGTGNFTKIVQRLPVRIKLNQDALANHAFAPRTFGNGECAAFRTKLRIAIFWPAR